MLSVRAHGALTAHTHRPAHRRCVPHLILFVSSCHNNNNNNNHRLQHEQREKRKLDAFSARVAKFRIHCIRYHKPFTLMSYERCPSKANEYICITVKIAHYLFFFRNCKCELESANAKNRSLHSNDD